MRQVNDTHHLFQERAIVIKFLSVQGYATMTVENILPFNPQNHQ